jgi:protein FRG1
MSTDKSRPSKLKFKGEKTKKKRKRENDSGSSGFRQEDDGNNNPETWVLPEDPSHIRGPTFIQHPSDPVPICVTYDANRHRIVLLPLDKDKTEDGTELPALLERIPLDISQVWVTTRVAGSETINLRTGTGEGKFLSCDAHGLVSADREARGPQEEWTPVFMPDGMVAFMNVYEKYLCVDEVAGGALTLRGDSEEVGFGERFWVKIQSKYKKEANDEQKKKRDGLAAPTMDEMGTK